MSKSIIFQEKEFKEFVQLKTRRKKHTKTAAPKTRWLQCENVWPAAAAVGESIYIYGFSVYPIVRLS